MTLIQWKDNFALGIPAVDFEHRLMIDLLNELDSRLGEGATRDEVLDFLGEIHAQIAAHFALEERAMHRRGYDQFAEHKASHEQLLDEIIEISDAYETSGAGDYRQRLSHELEIWFGEHFRTHDARLHRMLEIS